MWKSNYLRLQATLLHDSRVGVRSWGIEVPAHQVNRLVSCFRASTVNDQGGNCLLLLSIRSAANELPDNTSHDKVVVALGAGFPAEDASNRMIQQASVNGYVHKRDIGFLPEAEIGAKMSGRHG